MKFGRRWGIIAFIMWASAPARAADFAPAKPAAGVLTLREALASATHNNFSFRSLGEYVAQAEAARQIAVGMFVPKLQAEGQWVHVGEEIVPKFNMPNTPGFDASALADGFDAFIPPQNILTATLNLVVPVLNPQAIFNLRGALSARDAAIQRVGYGRDQILFGVAKAFYALVALQGTAKVAEQSLESARQHFKSNQIKADLQAATQLDVKRSELEVTKAESQVVEISAAIDKAKAAFRYLTGLTGDFTVVAPETAAPIESESLDAWQKMASSQRKDLLATRIDVEVASQEVNKVTARYFPSINVIAQGKADNEQALRFDNDPYSWNVIGTANLDIFDGGIREAQYRLARSLFRQKQLAADDLATNIKNQVEAAYHGLEDARAARRVAERQVDVAHTARQLVVASEKAGVSTNLEIIDTNTAVFAAEDHGHSARFREATAILDMLAAAGKPVPFSDAE